MEWTNPLPVTVVNLPGQPSSSGLTDAQLRATAVPVSGSVSVSNLPQTQPVSGTVAVSNLPATQPVSGTVGVSNFPATQPVSGTVGVSNFPATQPVSGSVSVSNLPATQPVSNAGTFAVQAAAPTLTKATQGATGFSTQDLKDAGRSARTIFLDSFAVAATAETLMTMSYSSDNAAATTGTSYSVTAGKRLRLQSILANIHTITGNTTAVNVIIRLRVNNSGAALVSSPVQAVIAVQGVAAANQAGIPVDIPIPDGWEFVAGAGIGVTVACAGFVSTTAAPKVDISIVGYEY